MKYNIGDIILWLFPIDRPEVSTIVNIHRNYDGSLVYELETYRKDEGLIKESFSSIELDHIVSSSDEYTSVADHYPVIK